MYEFANIFTFRSSGSMRAKRTSSSREEVSSGSAASASPDAHNLGPGGNLARSSSVPLRSASKKKRSKRLNELARVIEEDNNGSNNQGTEV